MLCSRGQRTMWRCGLESNEEAIALGLEVTKALSLALSRTRLLDGYREKCWKSRPQNQVKVLFWGGVRQGRWLITRGDLGCACDCPSPLNICFSRDDSITRFGNGGSEERNDDSQYCSFILKKVTVSFSYFSNFMSVT